MPHASKAWEFFRSIGSPQLHVAPMVDQSELPFRMMCRANGATCAYTPMFHARLFVEDPKYRAEQFTTCEGDRPLFVQFCANDPDHLLRAAQLVQGQCDAVDINLGCPQRIAKRGNYGSFLMDQLPLVEKLVRKLAQNLSIPVTCKIRVFSSLEATLAYARMLEAAGCCVLAVHGRTREQKDNTATRADWDKIRAVKQALQIPVLANGNIQTLADVARIREYTGVDGVLSAESLLADPALFSPKRLTPVGVHTQLEALDQAVEYLHYVLRYPIHPRMIKGHVHRMIGPWLAEYTEVRDQINSQPMTAAEMCALLERLRDQVRESGREAPVPRISARKLAAMEKEAAMKAAIEEQEREAAALSALRDAGGCDGCLPEGLSSPVLVGAAAEA